MKGVYAICWSWFIVYVETRKTLEKLIYGMSGIQLCYIVHVYWTWLIESFWLLDEFNAKVALKFYTKIDIHLLRMNMNHTT